MLAWFAALALAQSPPAGLTVSTSASPLRWLTADVVSERFLGEPVAGPKFTVGEEVEWIVEQGGKVRVHDGDRYGWVAATALTDQAPAPAAGSTANALLGGLPPLIPGSPGKP